MGAPRIGGARGLAKSGMRTGTVIFAALGALMLGAAPPQLDGIPIPFGPQGAVAAEHAKRAARPPPKAAPSPAFAGPRFGPPDADALKPTFSRKRIPADYAVIRAAPNPLVSAEYRGTPEYEYLFVADPALRSPPPAGRYVYALDYRYLLRPLLATGSAAAAYAWRDTPLHLLRQTVGAADRALRPYGGIVARNRGQKIDDALRPHAVLPEDQKSLIEAGPSVREDFAPVGRPGGR